MPLTDVELIISRRSDGSTTASMRVELPSHRVDSVRDVPITLTDNTLTALALSPDDYGATLTEMVFPPPLREAWREAQVYADSRKEALRVRLTLDGGDTLHSIHWELLRNPIDRSPLAYSEHVRLSRFLPTASYRPLHLASKPELRTVIAVANPVSLPSFGLEPVDIAGEVARAQQGLGDMPVTLLDGRYGRPATTVPALAAALRGEVHILYLVCHGALIDGEPFLWLEREGGEKYTPVAGTELVQALSSLEQRPLLVVLGSCQGAGDSYNLLAAIGPRLARMGIGAVLAMQGNIPMDLVAQLTPILFTELRRDGQIDRAVAAARAAVSSGWPWWMPVLWMVVRDGCLWRTGPSAEVAPNPEVTAFVELLGQVVERTQLPRQSIRELQRRAEQFGSLTVEQWAQGGIGPLIDSGMRHALQQYDDRLAQAGDVDDTPDRRQSYAILGIIKQVCTALRLEHQNPPLAGTVLRRLGRLYTRQQRPRLADKHFRRAAELIPPEDRSEYALVLRDWALHKLRNGQFSEAYKQASEAAAAASQAPIAQQGEFYYLLALCAFEVNEVGTYRDALAQAKESFQVTDDERLLGYIEFSETLLDIYLGRADRALERIERQLRKSGEDAELLLNQAIAFIDFGRAEEALKSIDRALAMLEDKAQEERALLQCQLLTTALDARKEILVHLARRDMVRAQDYFHDDFEPAYRSLTRFMADLGTDVGIEIERISTTVFWGEANLALGAVIEATTALEDAWRYINPNPEDPGTVSARIQYLCLRARIQAVHKRADEALAACQAACDLARAHISSRLLLVPALVLRAEIALDMEDKAIAARALADAQREVRTGVSSYRAAEIALVAQRLEFGLPRGDAAL